MTETTVKAPCPVCGAKHEMASSPSDPELRPQAGDATVCIRCAATLIFAAKGKRGLTLRRPTEAEADELRANVMLNRIKAAVIRVARAQGRDLP